MCVHVFVHVCACVCSCVCMCLFMCLFMCVHVFVHVCACVCSCVCICLFMCGHVCACVCSCVCIANSVCVCVHSFVSRLQSTELYHEKAEFEQLYEMFRGRQAVQGALQEVVQGAVNDPAISLVNEDCLQLDGGTSLGGSAAMALEKIVSQRALVSCHTLLPCPLFVAGQGHFPQDGAGEGEEQHSDSTSLSGELTTPLFDSALQRGLSEEEEGEEKEVQLHFGDGRWSGTGVNMLVQSNQGGSLCYGPIQLCPSLNVGRLLDCADTASRDQPLASHDQPSASRDQPSVSHDQPSASHDQSRFVLDATENRPTNRSLCSYLELCRGHLGFDEGECHYVDTLYGKIKDAGKVGVEEEELEESCRDNHSGRSFQDHVTALVNFEMVSL